MGYEFDNAGVQVVFFCLIALSIAAGSVIGSERFI